MKYDIFFSVSQTPAGGRFPSERQMFENMFDQVRLADELGFGVAWFAESHLSSEVQKHNPDPVIPHWKGEVGLNVDFLQLATHVFTQTRRIEVGSAIMNILCNGGPVAHAERVAAFLGFHGLRDTRRLHVGFAGGRFDFMNRAYGIKPRTPAEAAAWPALKGAVFARAAELFVRLLNGETLGSDAVPLATLTRESFRSDADWERVADQAVDGVWTIPPFFDFEPLKIVPADIDRSLLQLVIGSHDPDTQVRVNRYAPCQVFNLSITRPDVIDATHARLAEAFHPDGGPWQRDYMPRTTFVFLNADPALSPEDQRAEAEREARAALGAYWTALEGTLDPSKVERAATNALIGNPADVAAQMRERFHPDDRLMLWFDFFDHDNERVKRNMRDFVEKVAPLVEA
ncbi:MAG: LLM class flavin-dependent oxidoreductase [Myxococcales bacterium]|nr:LLM class flavin-dependent oxidoreductase [Myxococcales bacterium]MCB9671948.1 LLM class flavin-dependent oxidoreductase [Alphaproteobacteria bacterium]